MALQPRIIACGNSVAAFTMGVRFLTGPAVMAAASLVIGLRGVLLHVAIVQVGDPLCNTSPSFIRTRPRNDLFDRTDRDRNNLSNLYNMNTT